MMMTMKALVFILALEVAAHSECSVGIGVPPQEEAKYNNVFLYIVFVQSTCTHIIFNIICVSSEAPSSKGGPFSTNIIMFVLFL